MNVSDFILSEGDRRIPGPGPQDGYILIKTFQIISRLLFGPAAINNRAPSGQQAQLAIAGCLRIRGDHRNARPDQVGPILDSLRVTLAHDEHDHRSEGLRMVWQAVRPAVAN